MFKSFAVILSTSLVIASIIIPSQGSIFVVPPGTTGIIADSIISDLTEADILDRVIRITGDRLVTDDTVTINENTSFEDDLNADLVEFLELIMMFEAAFDVTIPDKEADRIETVGQAVAYIKRHLDSAKASASAVTPTIEFPSGDEGSILARVIGITYTELAGDDDDAVTIHKDTSFVRDLNASVIDFEALIMAFEEVFDVQIPVQVANNLQTVGQVVVYIEGYVGSATAKTVSRVPNLVLISP